MKQFLTPTRDKILACLTAFLVFQCIDFFVGLGGGVGFPFKFIALQIPFISGPGFLHPGAFLFDFLFFYLWSALFCYSPIGKRGALILLLITFFLVDQPLHGTYITKTPNEVKIELKKQCESMGRVWLDGSAKTLGSCQ